MSLWAPPTMSLYVCVTLLTNHQQICVLTCAQPTWSLTEFFPYSADHSATLWRHRWQKASEFLCTKTPLFGENWATKKYRQKIKRKCYLQRATNVVFSKFRGWRRKKKPRVVFPESRGQKLVLLHKTNLLFHWRCNCTILTFSLHLLKSKSIFRACPPRV